MNDIKDIRQNPDRYRQMMLDRGRDPAEIDKVLEVDAQARKAKTEAQALQEEANRQAKIIGLEKQIEKLDQDIAAKDKEIEELTKKSAIILEGVIVEFAMEKGGQNETGSGSDGTTTADWT